MSTHIYPSNTASTFLPSFSITGRPILITGAASGLGAHISQTLATLGCPLALLDIDMHGLTALQASIVTRCQNLLVTTHTIDVSDEDKVREAVAKAAEQHGGWIYGVVTCAGIVENMRAEEYSGSRARRLWDINVGGTWAVVTAVHGVMKAGGGGVMVLFGSMSGGIVNVPQRQTPYNASKAAVRHMAASLAVEWAEDNIRVNCVSPGYMKTALTDKILKENPELHEPWVGGTPLRRMGTPDDIDGPVIFLLSDAAQFVTGEELKVDGGYSVV